MKPLLIHTRHFPFGTYRAITLFPVILYKGRPLTGREERHERIHLWQQAVLLVVPFYVLYVLFWLVGLVRYRDTYRAYRSIPFERSAYALESCPALTRRRMAFDWMRRLVRPAVLHTGKHL